MSRARPIAIFYEHPHWFNPLFAELERRELPHRKIDAAVHRFDPAARINGNGPPPLLFNRMSPSAWKRGRGTAIFYTLQYLSYLESLGAPVVNGAAAFTLEISKALQVALLRRLGLPVPRTVVASDPGQLPAASQELVFPLLVKPNVGGSGAGIVRFDDRESLELAVRSGRIDPGLDGTLLLQEYHPPGGGSIVRIETLAGRYLYGIRVHLGPGAGFDLCPADICSTPDGRALESSACPTGAAKAGLTVERFDPPEEITEAAERIAREARLDVGGIEYLESQRDGRHYFYDINALSNFVADPERVVGFDPTARLVDYLAARSEGRVS
jgi:glutathione synthase/RimK-type ligase-like ATP-grasp enzyme